MVYVISKNGQPLMPTDNHAKVRILLKTNRAKVVNRCPFTIQLLYESTTHTQPVSLGIDAGSKTIGVSATTKDKVLYEAEVTLRNDIVDLIATRRQNRRTRRNRKTRYRKPRFNNRVHAKHKGWLAPSVQNKIDTHLMVVHKACQMLPVSKITVEVASFDTQQLKADIEGLGKLEGTDYQQGEQLGFWNVREYVLYRDGHICQCCKGKSKDKILNVHHIESRKTGGDAPNNLITLCETCHSRYHKGEIALPKSIHRGMSFKDATFMGIMRWAFYNKVKEIYTPQGIEVNLTYGYKTKNTRIKHNLPKEHFIDARCISGNPTAVSNGIVYYQKKVRCHNRQIHKNTILKDGYRKRNQAGHLVKGFRLYDVVKVKRNIWYIHARREKGSFVLKTLDGQSLEIVPSKIIFLQTQQSFITQKRKVMA